ncbi:hypothetical protein SERLA73DRAFT_170243 [Serpula lacrymans var. lacrymans S7.3]|uniref:Uncharacterized protein n=1 Tax=Serpula lacrymans var. lacrymans (strain S7.3) TaxID=936435 RepID=F8Q421_SERL3|nr:hypothetical protein SERLA73DRAFT_170243 [Serpula lacrymans var. lacrymans S7.3]
MPVTTVPETEAHNFNEMHDPLADIIPSSPHIPPIGMSRPAPSPSHVERQLPPHPDPPESHPETTTPGVPGDMGPPTNFDQSTTHSGTQKIVKVNQEMARTATIAEGDRLRAAAPMSSTLSDQGIEETRGPSSHTSEACRNAGKKALADRKPGKMCPGNTLTARYVFFTLI